MSACQHFKQAFLQQCTLAGLSMEETHAVVKSALDGLTEKRALSLADLAVGAPVAIGGLAGWGLAKTRELASQDEDPGEIKNRETIDALRRAAMQTRLRSRISARHQQVIPGRPLLR
jgi:hypothetical protein